jgi:LysR family transcriptional regulator, hydrogen peroxide-inducible genes activator
MAVPGEVAGNSRLKLMRFADPQPARTIGLAWRKMATRKAQFRHLGELLRDLWIEPAPPGA